MSCSGRGRASHGASPLNSVFGGPVEPVAEGGRECELECRVSLS